MFRELDNSAVDNTTTLVWKHKGFIYLLAWEPSVAWVTHSYSRSLPALGLKLGF